MSSAALGGTAILYIVASIGYIRSGKPSFAIAFFCYAIANIGFMLESLK